MKFKQYIVSESRISVDGHRLFIYNLDELLLKKVGDEMSVFSDYTFLSNNGETNIHVRRCTPSGSLRGIVQIAHGIAEHVERYDAFAAFLADHGYLVVANDHLGHGQSVRSEADLGFFAQSGGWDLAVGDMHKLYELTHAEFPAVPYFLFGHSMGSFLSRTYIIRYPDDMAGAIICGTGQQSALIVAGGKLMGRMECRKNGPRYQSEKLNAMAFGNYNKGFDVHRTDYDWLSRDDAVVDKYIADPLCGFIPTAGLFTDMMTGLQFIGKAENISRMRKSLPVFLIAGDKDPVGENGKGVRRVYEMFRKAGMQDVSIKLYPACRHEILNELNRDEVMNDVLLWLTGKTAKQ